jgi:hypothetical protein
MGIDIYARWRGMTDAERQAQEEAWLSTTSGNVGYLREAYHGEPYATRHLCKEAFTHGEAFIHSAVLWERMDETLRLAEIRERTIYHSDEKHIAEVKQSFRHFVALCGEKERETKAEVIIVASF